MARKAEREHKLAIFTAARAEGLSVTAAGERAGVARKTANRYEHDRLAALADGAEFVTASTETHRRLPPSPCSPACPPLPPWQAGPGPSLVPTRPRSRSAGWGPIVPRLYYSLA